MAKGTLRVRIAGDASGLKKTLGKTQGMLGKFAKVGLMGVAGAAAGAAAGIAGSIKAFADFDQAMTKSLAIMGDVSKGMRTDMSEAAREVGKTTSFSAKQAADSYFFLASAGMDAKESIEALPQVAAFAQAGMFNMSTATDLATDAQSALGMTSDNTKENIKQLTRTTDVFVKANTLANASVEEFATSMTRKAGAALKSLGKDIEEGTATLAVFADQGIKGQRAGTILRNTLEGLAEQSRENADEFRELGVKVFDAEGNMRNMAAITTDLEEGLAGMTTEQREATLATLGFTKEQREGILALLGNSDALREYESELRNAGGTAQEVANNQLDTFWEQLGLLKDQAIDLGISIGQRLMPTIRSWVEQLQENMPLVEQVVGDLMDAFAAFFGATERGSDESAKAVESMGTRSMTAMEHTISKAKETAEAYTGMGVETREAMGKASSSAESEAGVIRSALTTISDFINNTLIPAAEDFQEWWDEDGREMAKTAASVLGKVASAISDLIDSWEQFKAATREAARVVQVSTGNIEAAFRDLDMTEEGRSAGRSFLTGFRQSGLIAGVASAVDNVVSRTRERLDMRSPSKVFMSIGQGVAQGFIEGVQEGDIPTRFRHILGRLVGVGEEKFEELSGVLSSMADKATGVLETAGDATAKLVDLIGRDAARMKANLADSVSELEDMAKSAQQLASDINQGADDAVGPERVLQAMREADTPEELKEMLSESRQDVKEWSDALGKLADAGVHDGVLQTLIEAGPEGKKQAERLANSIGDPLFSIVQSHMHRTDGIIEDTVRDVGKHADLAAMQGEKVGSSVGRGVVDGILSQSDMIIGTFRNVMKGAVEESKEELGISSPSKVFMEMGASGIMAGLQRGIESKERDVARTLAEAMPSAVGGDDGGSAQKVEQHIHLESRGDVRDDAQTARLALMR